MKTIYLFAIAALLSTAAVAQTQLQQLQSSAPAAPSATGLAAEKQKLSNMKVPDLSVAGKAIDNAKAALAKSPNDFGGHRTKAVSLLTQAQNQLTQAQKYANSHKTGAPATSK